jgi:hypothetical protein
MTYHVRVRHRQTHDIQDKQFETALLRGLWLIGWCPYVDVLKQWESS